jgi:Activator of Hsp90 ATPase homolog 1-like protein
MAIRITKATIRPANYAQNIDLARSSGIYVIFAIDTQTASRVPLDKENKQTMKKQDFTTAILVEQTPKQAFDAINNVRAWWEGDIQGPTDQLGGEFTYRYQDFHYSKQQITELVPDKRIVWLVTESSINFVKDKNEWLNTKIIFDISENADGKTQIGFTHEGLTQQLECFKDCSNAWFSIISKSLKHIVSLSPAGQDFTTTIRVPQTPQEAFDAINNVRGWWSENIEGPTDELRGIFDYHYQDVHRCKIKVIELIPAQRVVWLVLDNYFKFTEDKSEWINSKIVFRITEKDGQTEIQFTHQGLVPEDECYDICNKAWSFYINSSLRSLIGTGKGNPTARGESEFEEQLLENKNLK